MSIPASIQSQYLAALEMLRQAVEKCPEGLWDERAYTNSCAQIAYHALFYLHLYLSPGLDGFTPWAGHRPGAERMQPEVPSYSKAEIAAYYEELRQSVGPRITSLALEAPSGFPWLPFNRLELHFYNLRHLHQHIGELSERLSAAKVEVGWVIKG